MKILVIGNVRPGHKSMVDLGHEIVVLMRFDHSHAPDVRFPYTCLTLMDNNANADEYAEVARTLHKFHKFERVACFNDTYQAFAVAVSEHLNLPYPHTMSTVNTMNDKYATRDQLANSGLDDTACQLIHTPEELAVFAANNQQEFMIKPLHGNASSGVTKVESSEQLDAALHKLQSAGHDFPIIVETFLSGPEYSVEAMSENGEHVIIGITEKFKDAETFIELGHIFPAPLDEDIELEINTFVSDVLTALQLTDGPSHTEIILTKQGPKVVETHSRAGGDNIFRLMELATGISIYQYEARQLAGESVLSDLYTNRTPKCTAAVKFIGLSFDHNTQLKSVDNVEKANALENVDLVALIKQPGDPLPPMKSSRERAAFAIATGEDADSAMTQCENALNTLQFNITWGLN